MAFQFERLTIPEVILVTPEVFRDERGFFAEVYKYPEFAQAGIKAQFLQVNHSKSQKNVVRGLHYQKSPMAQAKLVRVIAGEIFDVAVDIRKGSPSFGKWVGVKLNSQDLKMLYIPEGFAHGFCVLADNTEVVYYTSNVYAPETERGLAWNDPHIDIKWPVKAPVISKKDSNYPAFASLDNEFFYAK